MNRNEFVAYRKRYIAETRRALAQGNVQRDVLNEAAFPAYANPNPLIGFLFWSRIRHAMRLTQQHGPYAAALDFGCGGGVMLPFLARQADRVTAYDSNLEPLNRLSKYLPLPPNVRPLQADSHPLSSFGDRSFDLIIALDVLEHVDDLEATLQQFVRLLTSNGHLIVSGPTENSLYRLGRKLAGPEYSGAYHVRGMTEIETAIKKSFAVQKTVTLFPPFPLFRILKAEKRSA